MSDFFTLSPGNFLNEAPPIMATAFRIDAFGGDEFYSVSEFRAMGEPVPGSLLLIAAGLAELGFSRRKQQG